MAQQKDTTPVLTIRAMANGWCLENRSYRQDELTCATQTFVFTDFSEMADFLKKRIPKLEET